MPPLEATWEPYDLIQHQFPDFHLEDKVQVKGEGNGKPPILKTYQRRAKIRWLGLGREGWTPALWPTRGSIGRPKYITNCMCITRFGYALHGEKTGINKNNSKERGCGIFW